MAGERNHDHNHAHDDDRGALLMAAEDEARFGEPNGRLRLVPARRASGEPGSASAPPGAAPAATAAATVIRVALAPFVAATQASHADETPAGDAEVAGAQQFAAVLREVGAMLGLRFAAAEVGRADVVVYTDASMPASAPSASAQSPTAVVVLTEHDVAAMRFIRASDAVGWAVLPPTITPLALGAAITAVAQGLTVLASSHPDLLLPPDPASERVNDTNGAHSALAANHAHEMAGSASAPSTPALTGRERETLELLSEGLSNKLIARRLRISEHTVKFHISALYAKLGASSRADAVSRAARRGVLTLTMRQDTPLT